MQLSVHSKQKELRHILYSRGQLIETSDVDQDTAISKLASVTRRTTEQVKDTLLNGEKRKIKSSSSLKSLLKLQQRLVGCGLDAYIKLDPES